MSQQAPRRRTNTIDAVRAEGIRKRAGRFRVLIIGRANSGKTTILKKVCNSTVEPAIYDGAGVKIDLSVLKPSAERGLHDIDNEMVFESNPGFIFHDSRGFEAGTTTELKYVKDFIAQRAVKRKLKERIHAIWYCIPMDSDRPVTKAEIDFFSECGTGHVPVVVIFTKLDALDDKAFGMLKQENPDINHEDAVEQAPIRAQQDFEKMRPTLRIFNSRYPPKNYVTLRNMNLPSADCNELLVVTSGALDGDTLQLLFVATQQTSLKLCTTYAIGKVLTRMNLVPKMTVKEVQVIILKWYPHILDDLLREDEDQLDDEIVDPMTLRRLRRLLRDERELNMRDEVWQNFRLRTIQDSASIQAKLAHLMGNNTDSVNGHKTIQLATSLAIVAEHSFFLKQENHQINFKDSIETALDEYLASPNFPQVMLAVEALELPKKKNPQSPLRAFFQSAPPMTAQEKRAQSILHDKLVQIIVGNRLSYHGKGGTRLI